MRHLVAVLLVGAATYVVLTIPFSPRSRRIAGR